MELFTLVLAAMHAWVPVGEHVQFESRAVTEQRYVSIAHDIADTIEENDDRRVASPELEALLLTSVASYESHFAARVDSCKLARRSWTIFQISTNRSAACRDRKTAAKIALFRIRESFAMCSQLPFSDRLAFYVSGKVEHTWYSRSRVRRAQEYLRLMQGNPVPPEKIAVPLLSLQRKHGEMDHLVSRFGAVADREQPASRLN